MPRSDSRLDLRLQTRPQTVRDGRKSLNEQNHSLNIVQYSIQYRIQEK
jgi:hypothetical protein